MRASSLRVTLIHGEQYGRTRNMGRTKEIVCFETGEHFRSQKEAAEVLNTSKSNMNAALRRRMAVKGLHFYYADMPKADAGYFLWSRKKRVRCIETGTVYETANQAEKETGISHALIYTAASHKAGGYHWEYVDD